MRERNNNSNINDDDDDDDLNEKNSKINNNSFIIGQFINGIVSKQEFVFELNGKVKQLRGEGSEEEANDDENQSNQLISSNALFIFNKLSEIDMNGTTPIKSFFKKDKPGF